MPRMEAFPYGLYGEVPYTLTFEKATFFKGWEQTDWLTKRLCLTTHTELELLVQLPNFRLPGEDAVDAKRRRLHEGASRHGCLHCRNGCGPGRSPSSLLPTHSQGSHSMSSINRDKIKQH